MKKLLPLLVLLLLSLNSFSQTSSIKGFLKDSTRGELVDYATVAVFKLSDSSIVSFALTDRKGGFELSHLPINENLRILISHVLYAPTRINIRFDSVENRDLDTLYLSENLNELDEAVISWERPPILIRNDTVEFNADAFINRPGSMVEDLLKRIPGLEIAEDGSMTVNGKKVSKITLDSKQFFSEDPVIMLKNLPAKAIQTVQVTEEKDDRGRLTRSGNVVINLTLKSWAKTGHFGKAYAGYGNNGRYEAGTLWNVFRDTLQISFIGFNNNLSQTGFSYSDLYQLGGFDRSGTGRTTYYSDGRIEMDGVSLGGGKGITNSGGGGFNLNYDIPQKLKLNLAYFISLGKTDYTERTVMNTFFTDSSLYSNNSLVQQLKNSSHAIRSSFKWTPDTIHIIRYAPTFKFFNTNTSSNRNNLNEYSAELPSTQIINSLNEKNSGYEFDGELEWDMKLKKWSLIYYHSHQFMDQSGTGSNIIVQSSSDTTIQLPDQFQNRTMNYKSANILNNIETQYELNDSFTIGLDMDLDFKDNDQNTLVYQKDPNGVIQDILLPTISTKFNEKRKTFAAEFWTSYGLKNNWEITFRVRPNIVQLDLSNALKSAITSKKFQLLEGSIGISKRTPTGVLRMSINREPEIPYSWDLLDMLDNRNPNYLSTGNPNLNPSIENSVKVNHYGQIKAVKIQSWFSLNYNVTQNEITRVYQYNEEGIQISSPINLANDKIVHDVNSWGNFSRSFTAKKWTHRPSLNYYFDVNKGYTGINGQIVQQFRTYLSSGLSYTIQLADKIDTKLSYNYGQSNSSIQDLNSHVRSNNQSVKADVWWAITEKNWFEVKYTYTNQRVLSSNSIPQEFSLLNLSYTRLIFKDNRGQIRLSVFDALQQNTNLRRWAYVNSTTETQSNAVTRYFMLSFVYNLHKFKTSGRQKRGFEFFW